MADEHGGTFAPLRPATIAKTDPTNALGAIRALDDLIGRVGVDPQLDVPLRRERKRLLDQTGLSLAQAREQIARKGKR